MIVRASAPGRCGIVGNPSDMYGGSVISISTTERASCLLKSSNGLTLSVSGQTGAFSSIEDYTLVGDKLDIVRAVLKWYEVQPETANLHVEVSTEIPMQAGMAGSTAIVVALVGAISKWLNISANPYEIAETARKIENQIMGVVCGFQDQHMAAFGGMNYMDFAGKQSLEQLDSEPLGTIEPLQNLATAPTLVAAHTGVSHHSGTVHTSPRERWLSGDNSVISAYEQIGSLAKMGKKALLRSDWAELGRLMDENHRITAELGGSGEANERLILAAKTAGAFGAKLAGAGGGGTILALTDRPEEMTAALLLAGAKSIHYPIPSSGLTITTDFD